MPEDKQELPPSSIALSFQTHGLTFEQQKEMLVLQLEHEKMKHELEIKSEEMKHELEIKRQIEVERIRQESEKARLDLEKSRLSMIRDGKLTGEAQGGQAPQPLVHRFNVNNLRLLPQFNERDPDTFFLLFERVAKARDWPEADCALMLQCVLSGKAQEAYSSLSLEDSSSYSKIKSAVRRHMSSCRRHIASVLGPGRGNLARHTWSLPGTCQLTLSGG